MGPTLVKTSSRPRVAAVAAVTPYLIVLFFALYALRGLELGTPVDTDAARHAMNGVFLYDLARSGNLSHPVAFAKAYYSQYPSLSMPYHPPVFPLFEALFYFGFGVSLITARIAIAVCTGFSALLLYRLVCKTHRSAGIAAPATVLFFSLTASLVLATDVMLEMPTLALVLLSMFFLPGLDEDYSFKRAISFALIAAAAVWTKQNAVFLGLVPFVYTIFRGRWSALRHLSLWIGAALFGGTVVFLAVLSKLCGVTGNKVWPPFEPISILRHNIPYYFDVLRLEFGLLPLAGILLATGFAVWRCRRSHEEAPYLALIVSVFAVAFLMPPYDYRYVFFGYAGLAVVTCAALQRLAKRFLAHQPAWILPAAVAAAWLVTHLATRPPYVQGPFEAAKLIEASHPGRVLYCGRSNGNFTFAVRSLDPAQRTAIIRGDKLPPDFFTEPAFEQFAHNYGVNYVVFEKSPILRPWDPLNQRPPSSLTFVRELPLASSDHWMNGSLRVFRFANPSPTPETTLTLHSLGGALEAELPPERP